MVKKNFFCSKNFFWFKQFFSDSSWCFINTFPKPSHYLKQCWLRPYVTHTSLFMFYLHYFNILSQSPLICRAWCLITKAGCKSGQAEGLIYVYKHACLNQVNPVFCIKTSSPSRVTRANESPLNMTWCICTEVLHHRCENTGSVVISGYYTMTF